MHWTPRTAARYFLLLFCVTLTFAQTPVPADREAAADKVYQAHDWQASEVAYSSLTKAAPSNARFWYRLATAQKSLGKYDAALDSFATAEKAGTPRYLSQYAIAEAHALRGNSDASFRALDEALKAGYALPDQLSADADLASLRNDPRFAKILNQTRRAQAPCKFGPEFRQFDFWIGEWSVVTAKGEMPAGDSRIELSLGDCVIVENWTSKNNLYAGKSYNVYNVTEKRWE
jgi:tetratricopeptide (TPR) repeat protein